MRWRYATLVLVLLAGACSKAETSSYEPQEPQFAPEGLSLDDYEAMLAQNEAALRAQGVAIPVSDTMIALADRDDEDAGGYGERTDAAVPEGEAANQAPTEPSPDVGAGGAVSGPAAKPAAPSPPPTATPAPVQDAPAAEPAPAPESISTEGRILAGESGNKRAERRQARDRCEAICELAAATCELEARICGLASEHTDDPRYENACARATQDCDIAEEACRACSE